MWTESSVGLENPQPLQAVSLVGLQVGSQPHWEKLLRAHAACARPTAPPCQHLGKAVGGKELLRARWGPEGSQAAD